MTNATITLNAADALADIYDARRTKFWVIFNTDSGRVTDADGVSRLGAGEALPDAAGIVMLTGIPVPSGATNPTNFQVMVCYDAPAKAANQRDVNRERGDFGWMTVTGDANLKDLEAEQYAPPNYLVGVAGELAGYAADAEAARDAAVDISNISTPDSLVQALVKNTGGAGPLTSAALFASIDLRTGGVELSAQAGFVAGMNATAMIQGLVNNLLVKAISINAPIAISTVTIPVNRPIQISSRRFTNVGGADPLITILAGGSGIKLDGATPNLVVGVQLINLSFTSNDTAVVGAITGQDVTGLYTSGLYFSRVKGSAVAISGLWYDSAMTDFVAMDCGDSTNARPVIVMGSVSTDANRVTWMNARVERSSGTQVAILGNAYENDFIGCKFHGPTGDNAPLISIAASARYNRFVGGQMHVTPVTTGEAAAIKMLGSYNTFNGVTFTAGPGLSRVIDIYSGAFGNLLHGCSIDGFDRAWFDTGTDNEFASNRVVGSGWARCGDMSNTHDNEFRGVTLPSGQDTVVRIEGAYAKCTGNLFNGWPVSATYAIYTGPRGSIVSGNRAVDFSTTDGTLANLVYLIGSDHVVRDNVAVNITDSVVKQFDSDVTRDVSGNKKLAA